MTQESAPRFVELERAEAEAILARNHVGRIAFAFQNRVDVQPISYVYADGVITCRTAPGFKLDVLARNPWVAFEVDEVEGPLQWRSVVAYGTVYVADAEGSKQEVRAYLDAVERIRAVAPDALTEADPVGFRNVVLRIFIDRMSGRASEPGAA